MSTGCAGVPSSSNPKLPRAPGSVASAVTFMSSLPNRSDPIWSSSSQLVPANAASQPRIRSSSVAWPTDSWIWSAICSLPRIRSVASSDGHSSAVEQRPVPPPRSVPRSRGDPAHVRAPSRASRTGRGSPDSSAAASPVRQRPWRSSPAPHSTMCWSIRWPSLDAEPLAGVPDVVAGLGVVGATGPASFGSPPRAGRPSRQASTAHGSSRHSFDQWPLGRVHRRELQVRARDPGRGAGHGRRLRPRPPCRIRGDVRDRVEPPVSCRSARGPRSPPAPPVRGSRRRRCGRPSPRSGVP